MLKNIAQQNLEKLKFSSRHYINSFFANVFPIRELQRPNFVRPIRPKVKQLPTKYFRSGISNF